MQVGVEDVLCRLGVHSCFIVIVDEAHFEDSASVRATPDMTVIIEYG